MIETLDIKGYIKNLEPGEIFVTPNAIRINIITDGNIVVNLNGF
jgi:acylphosphatase